MLNWKPDLKIRDLWRNSSKSRFLSNLIATFVKWNSSGVPMMTLLNNSWLWEWSTNVKAGSWTPWKSWAKSVRRTSDASQTPWSAAFRSWSRTCTAPRPSTKCSWRRAGTPGRLTSSIGRWRSNSGRCRAGTSRSRSSLAGCRIRNWRWNVGVTSLEGRLTCSIKIRLSSPVRTSA